MTPKQLPTIQDVALALGMHKSTVSLALSGKGNLAPATRDRVLAAAREMGYRPNPLAQRLARGHRNATVPIFSGSLDVGLSTQKILLIQKELAKYGLEVPIYSAPDYTEDAGEAQVATIRQICQQRPRAVVCFAHRLAPEIYQELERYQTGGGIVLCYDHPAPLACDQVIFDREDNAYQATRYLIAQGHRAIALRTFPNDNFLAGSDHDPQVRRLKGFQRALTEAGLPFREDWVLRVSSYETGGAELARRFLELEERPSGICIVNDYVALAFIAEVLQAGVRVPEEVSVIGMDDQPIAAYCPVPLTSMTQPVGEIARTVVERLLARLDAGECGPPQTWTVRGGLTERASVASRAAEDTLSPPQEKFP